MVVNYYLSVLLNKLLFTICCLRHFYTSLMNSNVWKYLVLILNRSPVFQRILKCWYNIRRLINVLHSSLSAIVEFPFCWVFNNVMVFAIPQHESAIGICVSPPSSPTLSFQVVTEQWLWMSSHTSDSHWLSVLHMVIDLFQCDSLKSCYPISFVFSSFSLAFFFLSTCCDRDLKLNLHFFSTFH